MFRLRKKVIKIVMYALKFKCYWPLAVTMGENDIITLNSEEMTYGPNIFFPILSQKIL